MLAGPKTLRSIAVTLLPISLLCVAACSDCDLVQEAAAIATQDADYCGYAEPEMEGRDEIFECFYDAVDWGYPAWVAYRVEEDWTWGDPSTREIALVLDGDSTLTSITSYSACREFGHSGPCLVGWSCEAVGTVYNAPEDIAGPHGTGRIIIKNNSWTEHEVICP